MQSETNAGHLHKKRFWFFVAFSLISYLLMRYVSGGLTAKAIIEFEMAKTVETAKSIMLAWQEQGVQSFLNSTYGDFLFIIGYTGLLFYGCRFFGRLSDNFILKKAGRVFSILAIVAGVCDVLENLSMMYTVKIEAIGWITHLTYDLARIKFSLVFILLMYIVICLLFRGIDLLAGNKKTITLP